MQHRSPNHLGIAGMIASRQNLRGPEERDDLEQEARVGVIRGCERFNPQRGIKPSTFLSTAANGQVLHFRRDRTCTIGFPGTSSILVPDCDCTITNGLYRDCIAPGVSIDRACWYH